MNKHRIIQVIAWLGLVPLILALFFAMHHRFDWHILSGTPKHYARISAYIYIHYTAALLLIMMAGIQIGRDMDRDSSPLFMLFNLFLLVVVWFSYRSFGDFYGVLLLFMAWLAAFAIDQNATSSDMYPKWFSQLKFWFNTLALVLIGLVLIINR